MAHVRTIPLYSNIDNRCLLCLHKKSEIIYYPKTEELFNKQSELVAKYHHANKYIL